MRFVILLVLSLSLRAQPPAMSLEQAVAAALERYPSVRVSEAQVRNAAAAIDLARTSYMPRLDVIAGLNRASRNNVLGLLLPSQIIAPISGPVLNTNDLASAWGSTVGLLFTWEPFDFGLRDANVALAEAGRTRAEAGVVRTRLELATLTADSFLTLIAAQQTVTAANAAVERGAELLRITDALVKAELRPGVESSLARAEHASAQAQLIKARQAVGEAKANLAALVGTEPAAIGLQAGRLLSVPPQLPGEATLENNPLARDQDASIAETSARLHVLDKGYLPRFTIQGTTYARGTGAVPDGRLLGGANGLGPNIHNWGLGFTVTFPIFEYVGLRARKSAENARIDVERSRYRQILVELKARRDVASAAYEGALQITATTPIVIEAATAAVAQARARYQSGLGTALDVADAQRRLTQAEIDDSLARLGAWRARLAIYAAEGDIAPLLKEASQ